MSLNLSIGKIVGTTEKLSWAQDHVFTPQDREKLKSHGSLLLSLSIKAENEEIDTTSFGKEIISRFHEIYYSSLEKQVILRLKQSLTNLINEFYNRVAIEVSAAIIIERDGKPIIYAGLAGKGRVMILRDELVTLLSDGEKEVKTCSGFLKDNDVIVLGTKQFFEIVALGVLKASLFLDSISEGIESLAPLIHARQKNSESACVIFKVKLFNDKEPKTAKEMAFHPEPKQVSSRMVIHKKNSFKAFFTGIPSFIGNFSSNTKNFFKDVKNQPNIFIHDKERKSRAKKTTLSVALILIVLLLVSVFLGSRRKSVLKEFQKTQTVLQEADYKFNQANSLVAINPLRSRTLLTEARDSVLQSLNNMKDGKDKQALNELLLKIEAALENVNKEYKFEKADVFVDLSLAKDGFKGNFWAFSENILEILDAETGTVLTLDILSKTTKVAAGGEKLDQSLKIGAGEGNAFILKKNSLLLVDLSKGEVIGQSDGKDWGKIVDLVGFGESAYLLDVSNGKIWKYSKTGEGLSAPKSYFNADKLNLEDAVSFSIDGSVWILFSDGTILKYTRGIKDNFNLSGLENNFKEPEKIYTDGDLDNLYVLDRKNTRVVVINKATGEYQASYVWPGISGVKDIFASEKEGKLLLLTGEKIYEIGLRR